MSESRNLAHVSSAAESPVQGVPKYYLEHALINLAVTFDSPNAVANLRDISIDFRSRILQVWEYDIRAAMSEENEGGRTRDILVNALDEIVSARALLEMEQVKPGNGQMALHSVGR